MDNFDATISYGLQYVFQNFIISPRYALTYKSFSDGSNDGREDLIHSLSLKVDYPINDDLNVGVFGSFSKRDTDGVYSTDYESMDGGVALGLNTTF